MKAALVEIGSGVIVAVGELPFKHVLADGGTALLIDVGQEVPVHAVIYRVMEYIEVALDRPGTYFTQGADVETRLGNVITITRQWTAWTQQQINTYEAARLDSVAAQFDVVDNIERAAVLAIMDELNLHATTFAAIFAAAASATTLAQFKIAMAAITAVPQRSAAQIKTAIRNKLGN